jgi:hypothetical protein
MEIVLIYHIILKTFRFEMASHAPKHPREYSKFQLFVLMYLYTREYEEGRLTKTETQDRVGMTIEDFINVAPAEIQPFGDRKIWDELNYGLLPDRLISDWGEKYYLVHSAGQQYVKKYLGPILRELFEKQEDEKFLDNFEVDKGVKSYFKGLWDELKVKSQEQIAEGLITGAISGAKKYGASVVLFITTALQGSPSPF